MPYGEDKKFIREKLKEFSEIANRQGNQSLLVGHLGINGAELMGTKAEGEFNAGDFYPDIFDFIYMGHYHKRQRINGLDTFIYGGSTIQNTFSDAGQEKDMIFYPLTGIRYMINLLQVLLQSSLPLVIMMIQ